MRYRKRNPGSRRLRPFRLLAVLTFGLATISAGAVTMAASPAQAACYNGTSYGVTMYYNDHLIGQEQSQYASTCDGDGQYRGHVYDMYTDGSCVSAYFWNPSKTRVARSCDSAGTYYTFNDATNDGYYYAYWDMCTTYHCRYYTQVGGDDVMMSGY